MSGTWIRVLGPLEVRTGGERLYVPAGHPEQLLTVLLLHAGQALSVETLMSFLWEDEPPPTARKAIQVHVSQLRRALAPVPELRIHGSRHGYRLELPEDALDLHAFRSGVRRAQSRAAVDDPALVARLFREALELWPGVALTELAGTGRGRRLGAALEEERLAAWEAYAVSALRSGAHHELVGQLSVLLAAHPLRETLRGQLMLALYRAGRQAEALSVFAEGRRLLADELGLEPGQELRDLHVAILNDTVGPAATYGPDPSPVPAADGRPTATDRVDPAGSVPAPAARPVPVPVPRQLPPAPATFVGRDPEAALLRDALTAATERTRVAAVHGPGGIGKSALALHVAHAVADRFPDGQFYVDLQGAAPGLRPLAPVDVHRRFLRALDTPPLAIPAEPAEAAALYRSLLARRRVLVVLDNAVDAQQVAPLLPASPGSAVLVTSRRVLATLEARQLALPPLAEPDAVALLALLSAATPGTATPEDVARVARDCGYLPLALRIAAARLGSRPDWAMSTLARRLADERHRLDELHFDDLAVRSSFRVSYEELSDGESARERVAARAFRLLGLLQVPSISGAVAAALLDLDEAEAERAIDPLVDARLVEAAGTGRYIIHDLLRLFAIEQAEQHETPERRTAAVARALAHYRDTLAAVLGRLRPHSYGALGTSAPVAQAGLDTVAACVHWLAAEAENLLAAARAAADSRELAHYALALAHMLYPHFWKQELHAELAATGQIAATAAGHLGTEQAEQTALLVQAAANRRTGRLDLARTQLERVLELRERGGDLFGQGRVLGNLGIVFHDLGRFDEAEKCFLRAIELVTAHGPDGAARVPLHSLAQTHQAAGRYRLALDHARRSLALADEQDDVAGRAYAFASMGQAYCQLGDLDEALALLTRCVELCREIGERTDEWEALLGRSEVHLRRREPEAARADAERSLAITRESGDPYGRGAAHRQLARALRMAGRHAEAGVHRVRAREALDAPGVRRDALLEDLTGYPD